MDSNHMPTISMINQQRVLFLLRTRGPLSRADISRATGLTKATVSKIVEELEQNNLIEVSGVGGNVRGRPSVSYTYNTASALAVGVEVKQGECQAIVTKMDAKPLSSYRLPLPGIQPEDVVQVLVDIMKKVREEYINPIVGIGIGVPGICDEKREVVIYSERLAWKDIQLVRMLKEHIDIDVCVENRANVAALGERWYGAGTETNDFILVHIGSGIKAGIVLHGEIYMGGNRAAGEIGHLTVAPGGPLCVCGKRGCLESVASTTAIRDHLAGLIKYGRAKGLEKRLAKSPDEITLEDVIMAAGEGDEIVLQVLKESAHYLGVAVASLINIVNPQRIILGDFANHVPPIYLETVRETARKNAFEIPWEGVDIVTTTLGQQSVTIGAAALMLSKDFQRMQATAIIDIN